MASVEKRIRDGQVTWLARWRDPEGKQRKKSFSRRVDADRFLATVSADIVRGQYIDPADRTTVAEYAWRWAESRPHGPRTAERTESMIRNHIEGTRIGGRRLAAVLPSEAQAWVTERSKVLAPSTLRAVARLLRSIYSAAVLDRLVALSPMIRLSVPSAHRERVIPLTVDQVRDLAETIAEPYRAMVLTQAGLGLRIGELLALRANDVDFLRRTVRIEWQAEPRRLVLVPPKTPRSRRTIPLPEVVAGALAEHLRRHPARESGLIFHTRTDRPHAHEHYGSRVFGRAVRDAGLPEGTSTHDLRHHYASVLLYAGESVVAVAERLGHENAALVLSTYGHLMPDSEDRTRRAVDEAWSAPDVPQIGGHHA